MTPELPLDFHPASLILIQIRSLPTFRTSHLKPSVPGTSCTKGKAEPPASSLKRAMLYALGELCQCLLKQVKGNSPSGAPPWEAVQDPPAGSPWEIRDTLILGRLEVLLPDRGLEGRCRFSWTLTSSFSASSVCSDEMGTKR